jgi:hypothetical protein
LKPGNPALRQRLRRIEYKPKPVHTAEFQDFACIDNNPALRDQLDEIILSIERGDGVPEAHYRAGIDRDDDALLAEKGIMQLHLGGKDSDVLVLLIQYSDRVVLLETDTHVHFRTQPAGKNIVALTQAWLRTLECEMTEATTHARMDATAAERHAAAVLSDRRAAAIAAFKAKLRLR